MSYNFYPYTKDFKIQQQNQQFNVSTSRMKQAERENHLTISSPISGTMLIHRRLLLRDSIGDAPTDLEFDRKLHEKRHCNT